MIIQKRRGKLYCDEQKYDKKEEARKFDLNAWCNVVTT